MFDFLTRNAVFGLFTLILLWLAAISAVFEFTHGFYRTLPLWILSVWAIASLTYVAISNSFNDSFFVRFSSQAGKPQISKRTTCLLSGFFVLYAAIVVSHIAILGYIPVLKTLRQTSDVEISIIRQDAYFSLPGWMRYASDYCLKALGPALLSIAFYYRSKLFWPILIVGCLYCFALFARVLPIFFLMPLIVLALTQRRWLSLLASFALLISMVGIATSVSAPSIRDKATIFSEEAPAGEALDQNWKSTSATYALYERAVIVPARVIDQWFSSYRQPGSPEWGCGYRALASILGCDYVHVPAKLYDRYYPDNVRQGMTGSLNAAYFMTDYANFGVLGFVVSGILAGAFYTAVVLIYSGHPLSVPLNLSVLVAMMETNFFTAINSGSGWIVTTMIFLLFFGFRKARC